MKGGQGQSSGAGARRAIFLAVMILCAQFLVLTTAAMFTWAGEYDFLGNFFSELGQWETAPGRPNTASFLLFNVSLGLAGAGLLLFFAVYQGCFRESTVSRLLAALGAFAGVSSGVGFIGVAFTPLDLSLVAHEQWFLFAFRTFPAAVTLCTVAILLEKGYPKRYAALFGSFAVLLILYLLLITFGPDEHTAEGKRILATGQKIIAYAAIASVFLQAWGARGRCGTGHAGQGGEELRSSVKGD